MSAFVMEQTGFDTLAQQLFEYATSHLWSKEGQKRAAILFLFDDARKGYKATEEELSSKIELRINNLLSANNHAVEQRYEKDLEPGYYKFERRSGQRWSSVQLIKHLQCLRYQMTEGKVPEMKVYELLSELIAGLCEAYISKLDEYEKADWGW